MKVGFDTMVESVQHLMLTERKSSQKGRVSQKTPLAEKARFSVIFVLFF